MQFDVVAQFSAGIQAKSATVFRTDCGVGWLAVFPLDVYLETASRLETFRFKLPASIALTAFSKPRFRLADLSAVAFC